MKKISLLLSFILLIVACHTDGCRPTSTPSGPIGMNVDVDALIAKRGSVIANSCEIVPLSEISSLLDVPERELTVTNSSPRDENATHSSCFFKFNDPEISGAGILIQIKKNPVGDEYPNYVSKFISSKREYGEQTLEGGIQKYQFFEGFGDDGSYSSEAGKYFWRMGNSVIFGIAFNTAHTPEQQYAIATKLARSITMNYMKV